MDNRPTIDKLRADLDEIDAAILRLVAERRAVVRSISTVKRMQRVPLRDYARERAVLVRAAALGREMQIPEELSVSLLKLLITDSLTVQERTQVSSSGAGNGKTALVIGGAGKMGRWFAEFLASSGFVVTVADPSVAEETARRVRNWENLETTQDLIVVATPISAASRVLAELARRRPRGIVFDVASLKEPLRAGFDALARAGCRAVSIHPMFGPETPLLSGKHVIFVPLGNQAALRELQRLFAATMVAQTVMSLEEHDRLMGYVLGLSHATNIAFSGVLADSGELGQRLLEISSTTFDQQLKVAQAVAEEDPELYFQIQRLNAHRNVPIRALQNAVSVLSESFRAENFAAFEDLMLRGRAYFRERGRAHAEHRGGSMEHAELALRCTA